MKGGWLLVGTCLIVVILLVSQVGLTQPTSEELNKLLQDIESLKAGQKAISNDLQEIKKLLSSRGGDRSPIRDIDTIINVSDGFVKGENTRRSPSSNSRTTSDPSVPDTSVRRSKVGNRLYYDWQAQICHARLPVRGHPPVCPQSGRGVLVCQRPGER